MQRNRGYGSSHSSQEQKPDSALLFPSLMSHFSRLIVWFQTSFSMRMILGLEILNLWQNLAVGSAHLPQSSAMHFLSLFRPTTHFQPFLAKDSTLQAYAPASWLCIGPCSYFAGLCLLHNISILYSTLLEALRRSQSLFEFIHLVRCFQSFLPIWQKYVC